MLIIGTVYNILILSKLCKYYKLQLYNFNYCDFIFIKLYNLYLYLIFIQAFVLDIFDNNFE